MVPLFKTKQMPPSVSHPSCLLLSPAKCVLKCCQHLCSLCSLLTGPSALYLSTVTTCVNQQAQVCAAVTSKSPMPVVSHIWHHSFPNLPALGVICEVLENTL